MDWDCRAHGPGHVPRERPEGSDFDCTWEDKALYGVSRFRLHYFLAEDASGDSGRQTERRQHEAPREEKLLLPSFGVNTPTDKSNTCNGPTWLWVGK